MYKCVVWYNPRTSSYYHKIVRGFYTIYNVGYRNQSNHVIIYIFEIERNFNVSKKRLKETIIDNIILYLRKLERR